ncbi:Cytochrome P450 9e2 [Orchesella cincta]|uniref:Cytochrome P450 9e2 n=1 Tax=Orchesella cincta TaxID=48709 RepID=A0A1D2M768_ORCCI|nr:Cytochrome P450 9e2 [Orchesella cincta]
MLVAFVLLFVTCYLFYNLFLVKSSKPKWLGEQEINTSASFSTLDMLLGRKTVVDKDHHIYNSMGTKTFCVVDESPSPIILLKDLDLIKKAFIKDFDYFTDRRDFFTVSEKISFKQTSWHAERRGVEKCATNCQSYFYHRENKRMMVHFNGVGQQWVKMLAEKARDSPTGSAKIDVLSTVNQYTLEVIGNSVFGMRTGTIQDPNSIFAQKAGRIANMDRITDIIKLNLSPRYPQIFKMLGIEVFDKDAVQFFNDILRQSLEARLRGDVKQNDFQQLLIEARKGELKALGSDDLDSFEKEAEIRDNNSNTKLSDKSKILTDEVIIAQGVVFFLAGFTAVSNFISFAAYSLALHQDIQDKLREEVGRVVKEDGTLDYDDLAQLTYLDMVANEVLRKFPGAARLDRVCMKDYRDPETGLFVPKNTAVVIPVHAIHNDKRYYENPEKFDPEHFTPEKKAERSPYSYLPFGQGPRNCIGKRFAIIESQAAIANLVHNFRIDPTEKTPVPLQARFIGAQTFLPMNLELMLTPLRKQM